MKLRKRYLIFLVLYLIALVLLGANRMKDPDVFLTKMVGFFWGLAPSQTFNWFFISLIALVILLALVFAAGCYLLHKIESPV